MHSVELCRHHNELVEISKQKCTNTRTHLIASARDDLTVISREGNAKNIVFVTDKAAGSCTLVQVPKTESVIPRAGKSELTIGRDDNVRDEVAVAMETLLGDTIVALLVSQVPDDDGLVCIYICTKKSNEERKRKAAHKSSSSICVHLSTSVAKNYKSTQTTKARSLIIKIHLR